MTELHKTIAFVAVAAVLLVAAVWWTPSQSASDTVFSDQGEFFFPNFKDPLACTSLEVIDYDPATATTSPFKVEFRDGKWVIPSHHNYPADAKDRLAKTAGGVMDLKKDTIRSDRVEDHEQMGVVDPLDTKSVTLKGRGKRVTLRNKSDEVLAEFIIGKEVPDRPDQRFVRVPGQKRTYGVNVKVDLSTRFADWIETNLLKLDSSRVRTLTFDNHKVFPEEQRVEQGEQLTVTRKEGFGPWTLEKMTLEPDQEVNADKLSTLTNALSDLKIVGVRPKPAGLTRDLKASSDGSIKLTQTALLSLASKGFYITPDGRLLSNQGDLLVTTDEGITYTLRFGEVVFASGEELTAGVEDEKAANDKEKDKAKNKKDEAKKEGGTESRYLFVTVAFDPDQIPPPEPPKPRVPSQAEVFEEPFQKDPNDPKLVEEKKAAEDQAKRAQEGHDRKVKEGKDRAQELTDRFAAWYYVVPGDSFRSLMLDRSSLVRKKQENPAPGVGAPGGFGGGLPPSFGQPPR